MKFSDEGHWCRRAGKFSGINLKRSLSLFSFKFNPYLMDVKQLMDQDGHAGFVKSLPVELQLLPLEFCNSFWSLTQTLMLLAIYFFPFLHLFQFYFMVFDVSRDSTQDVTTLRSYTVALRISSLVFYFTPNNPASFCFLAYFCLLIFSQSYLKWFWDVSPMLLSTSNITFYFLVTNTHDSFSWC